LVLGCVLALVALTRPLRSAGSPRLQLAVAVALGLGVAGSALLASLKGRGRAEPLAFYAFLLLSVDALGQVLAPLGWPAWPLVALVVGPLAVAERLAVALAAAALATVLTAADAVATSERWLPVAAAGLGYFAIAFALNRALLGEKRRLSATLGELARLKQGIDHVAEGEPPGSARPPGTTITAVPLRQVSQEGRRTRQADRAQELDAALLRVVRVARKAVSAHTVVYFVVDHEREQAHPRAWDGPDSAIKDVPLPLRQDPFAFVIERRQSFYVTDFPRLLGSLPYYRSETRIGSLLAVPVKLGDAVAGVLVADRLEIQSLTGKEAELIEAFAEMAAEAVQWTRASLSREELGAEFRAVHAVSRSLTELDEPTAVHRRLVQSAWDLVEVEGAAVAMVDDEQTRYVVESGYGWVKEFEGREVGLSERTWTAWVLKSSADFHILDLGDKDRMPVVVLDEGKGRAASLLGIPLKTGTRNIGALILTGGRESFATATGRVLGFLCNHAAAVLSKIRAMEHVERLAARDGLTGLYNRRTFDDYLARTLAVEERRGGRFATVLLDLDHFKKLNDTYGHPAGDAALRNAARVLERQLRKGDQAARYGGEEFAVILPGADEDGALQIAERVRRALEKDPVIFEGARISITASLGVAVWPVDGKDAAALLASADRALYAAKQAGRNRVTAASRVPQPGPSAFTAPGAKP
jgi:diguanylate cyclase (GGDEF)-like protein